MHKLIPVPENFEVTEEFGELIIKKKESISLAFFILLFTIVWDIVAFRTIHMAFDPDTPLLLRFFPIIRVASGLVLIYITLILFQDSMIITVNWDTISIKFKPLPWIGQKSIERNLVKQLFVNKVLSKRRGGVSYFFDIMYIDKDGISRTFLRNTHSEQKPYSFVGKLNLF